MSAVPLEGRKVEMPSGAQRLSSCQTKFAFSAGSPEGGATSIRRDVCLLLGPLWSGLRA